VGIIVNSDFTLGSTIAPALATANLTFSNNMNLGGAARTITLGGMSGVNIFSGIISNGGLTLNSAAAANILTLGGANTYSGATTVDGGTLKPSAANRFSPNSALIINASGTVDLTAFAQAVPSLSGSGVLTNVGTTAALTTGSDNTSTTFSGTVTGTAGLTKTGTGTLMLSGMNTNTGITTINGGKISVATIGNSGSVTSNLSGATNAAANLVFGGGVLEYTGATAATDRNYTLTAATTSTIEVVNAATNLTLSGANTATSGALTKTGAGTLTLTGNNLATGAVTVTAGKLELGAADRIAVAPIVLDGGVFSTGATTGFNETVGTLDLNNNSTLNLGTGVHTLTFANSSAVAWASGKTLTITGWVGSGTGGTAGKIMVGVGGLTVAQLAQITFTGYVGSAQILPTGELALYPPCATPAAQPTAFVSSAITKVGMTIGFTAASPAPDKYLVIRSTTNTAPTPVDGTNYLVGETLGDGTVVSISNATSGILNKGLMPSTTYYYFIYAYNSVCANGPKYKVSAPLTGSATTLASTVLLVPTNYATIKLAYNAASNGDIIRLVNGAYIHSAISGYSSNPIPVAKSVIIDGQGSTITRTSGSPVKGFLFGGYPDVASATPTLKNITLCNYNGGNGSAIGSDAFVGSFITLENVNVVGVADGATYAIWLESDALVKNCYIGRIPSPANVGGIRVKTGVLTTNPLNVSIVDTKMECTRNPSSGGGGSVWIGDEGTSHNNNTINIINCSIASNSLTYATAAGGIYYTCGNNSTLNIKTTAFVGNNATSAVPQSGAAIYASSTSATQYMNISKCIFDINTDGTGSGAVYSGNTITVVEKSVFRDNTGSGTVISGVTALNNLFTTNGGGVPVSINSTFLGSVTGNTDIFNYAGNINNSCTFGCTDNPVSVVALGAALSSTCFVQGGTLTSTQAGLWHYQQASGVGVNMTAATTVTIPTITGYTVFYQDATAGTDPLMSAFVFAPAAAGPDQTTSPNTTLTLAGSDPTGASGVWSIVSGPNSSLAQFANVTLNTSTFTPTVAGTYTLRWTIDGCSFDEVKIMVLGPVYAISGTIFNDGNGLSDSNINGSAMNGTESGPTGVKLYINVLSSTGVLVTSVEVAADGTYTIPGTALTGSGNYTLVLTTSPTATTPSLPSGWNFEGETFGTNNGAGTGNDATGTSPLTLGTVVVSVGSADVTGVNFGLNKTPTVVTAMATVQTTPSGTTDVSVAGLLTSSSTSIFGVSDLESTITSITLTSFPTSATSFTVGTTTYYPTVGDIPAGCTTCAAFPASGGVNVPTNAAGVPTNLLIDPSFTGGGSIDITYTTTDGAGKTSLPAISSVPFSAPLPVKLLHFTAEKKENTVHLDWVTASELNNAFFEIERSTDALNYKTIGTVRGNGTTNIKQYYAFIDAKPYLGRTNYYRLRQVDFDGKAENSPITSVFLDKQGNLVLLKNPVNDLLEATITLNETSSIEVNILAIDGRRISTQTLNGNNGVNRIEINTTSLAAGTYLLQVRNNTHANTIKFIKE
jgi:autotransporter-associated beta strand protein